MRGVECGPDRRPVAKEALYPLARRAWSFECDGIEIVVGGGPKGPRPKCLELAERVTNCIEAFAMAADNYLAAFVVPATFEARRPWDVYGIEFGRHRLDQDDEFEMLLSLSGDNHAIWGVRFKAGIPPSDRFYPIEFRRRQR